jgi:hypothetical protein
LVGVLFIRCFNEDFRVEITENRLKEWRVDDEQEKILKKIVVYSENLSQNLLGRNEENQEKSHSD